MVTLVISPNFTRTPLKTGFHLGQWLVQVSKSPKRFLPASLMAVLPHDFPLTYFQSVSYLSHLGHWWQFCLMTSHLHIFNQFLTWVTWVIDGSFAQWLPINIFSISFLPESPGSLMAALPNDFPLTYFQSVSYLSGLGHWWQFCLHTNHSSFVDDSINTL